MRQLLKAMADKIDPPWPPVREAPADTWRCRFCGYELRGLTCPGCGAPRHEREPQLLLARWPRESWSGDTITREDWARVEPEMREISRGVALVMGLQESAAWEQLRGAVLRFSMMRLDALGFNTGKLRALVEAGTSWLDAVLDEGQRFAAPVVRGHVHMKGAQ